MHCCFLVFGDLGFAASRVRCDVLCGCKRDEKSALCDSVYFH